MSTLTFRMNCRILLTLNCLLIRTLSQSSHHDEALQPIGSEPQNVTLLDTTASEWQDWQTNTGKYEGWRLQTHPLLQRKIQGVCQIQREENNNWLVSPLLTSTQPGQLILLQIAFTMRNCSEYPRETAVSLKANCRQQLEVLMAQSDHQPKTKGPSDRPFYDQSAFNDIVNLTIDSVIDEVGEGRPSLDDTLIERVYHFSTALLIEKPFFQLAVRDQGACTTLHQTKLSHLSCPRITWHLLSFPATPVRKDRFSVTGQCLDGAIPTNLDQQPLPYLFCSPSGHWLIHTNDLHSRQQVDDFCICGPGFAPSIVNSISDYHQSNNSLCYPCPQNTYKTRPGSSNCKQCPANSFRNSLSSQLTNQPTSFSDTSSLLSSSRNDLVSNPLKSSSPFACECNKGFQRHPFLDNEHSPCTTVPSQPELLQVNTSDTARVILKWKPPKESGGRPELFYQVECRRDNGRSCSTLPTYIALNNRLNVSRTILVGLELDHLYTVKVSARNELSKLLPNRRVDQVNSSASIQFRLPPPVKISVDDFHTELVDLDRLQYDGKLYKPTLDRVTKSPILPENRAVRLSWSPVVNSRPLFRLNTSSVSQSIDHRPYFTVEAKSKHLLPSSKSRHDRPRVRVKFSEYQIFIWISLTDHVLTVQSPPKDPDQLPVVCYFTRQNQLYMTQLPVSAKMKVWIRPRIGKNWGVYVEKNFNIQQLNLTDPSDMANIDCSDPEGLSASQLQHASNWSSGKRTKLIWLSILLVLLAILLICFLLYLAAKRHNSLSSWFGSFGRRRYVNTTSVGRSNPSLDRGTKSSTSANKTSTAADNSSKVFQELQREDVANASGNYHDVDQLDREDITRGNRLNSNIGKRLLDNRQSMVNYLDRGDSEVAAGEIDASRIKLQEVVGKGEFGEVCAGHLDGYDGRVACKTLHANASSQVRREFLQEIDTMRQFDHPNLVKLLGVVVTLKEPKMMLLEFMHNGSLDRFLQALNYTMSAGQLLRMLRDICQGMTYLASMGYVHRDLAARNVLVDVNEHCKVSDFGLTRKLDLASADDAYTLKGGKVPVRWTAPEAILYRRFTLASDVWSYGIVAWETYSYGQRPYWDWPNHEVIKSLNRGYRLPAPSECPTDVYKLMLDCWETQSEERPTFDQLDIALKQLIGSADNHQLDFTYHIGSSNPLSLSSSKLCIIDCRNDNKSSGSSNCYLGSESSTSPSTESKPVDKYRNQELHPDNQQLLQELTRDHPSPSLPVTNVGKRGLLTSFIKNSYSASTNYANSYHQLLETSLT